MKKSALRGILSLSVCLFGFLGIPPNAMAAYPTHPVRFIVEPVSKI